MMTWQSGHTALVAALRREEAAARCVARLTRELEAQRDVTKQREMDAQRTKMIIRLKEDKIARLQVPAGSPSPSISTHNHVEHPTCLGILCRQMRALCCSPYRSQDFMSWDASWG